MRWGDVLSEPLKWIADEVELTGRVERWESDDDGRTWHHIAVVKGDDGTETRYVDGVRQP